MRGQCGRGGVEGGGRSGNMKCNTEPTLVWGEQVYSGFAAAREVKAGRGHERRAKKSKSWAQGSTEST